MRLTVSLTCYQRPQRTRRMIDCVLNQNFVGYELLAIGDSCPVVQEMIDSKEYVEKQLELEKAGNKFVLENLEKNYGGCGYEIINRNIQRAQGDYFIFLSNDDIILPHHFHNYVTVMENNPHLDFAIFDTWVNPKKEKRIAELKFASIGHAELVVKTSFIKTLPPHTSDYGHDWLFITDMIKSASHYAKAEGVEPSYLVMGVPGDRESGID